MINKITAALAALLISAGWADAQVSLSGTGTVKAKPDIAYVTLAVVTEGKTGAEATAANTKDMKTLCDAVEAIGIKTDDIKTQGYNVSPKYIYQEKGEARIVGYTVSNSLYVTVNDLKVVGTLLDKAVVSGANRVAGVQFDVKDKAPLFAQARKNALADAKAKADLYAGAGGFKLGVIKTLTEQRTYDDDGVRSEAGYMRAASAGGDRAPVPVSPGEVKIHVNINVTWAIE